MQHTDGADLFGARSSAPPVPRITRTRRVESTVVGSNATTTTTMPALYSESLPSSRSGGATVVDLSARPLTPPPWPAAPANALPISQPILVGAPRDAAKPGYDERRGVNAFVNWPFERSMRADAEPEDAAAELRMRQLSMYADLVYKFSMDTAGRCGRTVQRQDVWDGAEGSGAIHAIIHNLSRLNTVASGDQPGELAQAARAELETLMRQLQQAQPALSGGGAASSSPEIEAARAQLASLLLASNQQQQRNPPPATPLMQLAAGQQQQQPAPATGPALGNLQPEPLQALGSKRAVLGALLLRPNFSEAHLRGLAQLFDDNVQYFPPGRAQPGTAPDLRDPAVRDKLIDQAIKLRRLFQRNDVQEWHMAPENAGMMFLTEDFKAAIDSAAADVRARAKLPRVATIELMTHGGVSTRFSELVAKGILKIDSSLIKRHVTRSARMSAQADYERALVRFAQPRLRRDPSSGELVLDYELHSTDGSAQYVHAHGSDLRERDRASEDSLQYARANGRYFSGGGDGDSGRRPYLFDRSTRGLHEPQVVRMPQRVAQLYTALPELGGGYTEETPSEQRQRAQRSEQIANF